MKISEITSQLSTRINEFKVDLNLQTGETIEQVISEQVLPTIRETLGESNNGDQLVMDRTFSGREKNSSKQPRKKHCDKVPKLDGAKCNLDSLDVENSYETQTG